MHIPERTRVRERKKVLMNYWNIKNKQTWNHYYLFEVATNVYCIQHNAKLLLQTP